MEKLVTFITEAEYETSTRKIGGAHWASAGSRWAYHNLAATWAREMGILSSDRVLEIGTMGVSVIKGSDTLDYDAQSNNKDWIVEGYTPTFIHDARRVPWPIEPKRYDLVVALRVFHHLLPKQRECFDECRRVGNALILVVPSRMVHPRGINREELVNWNAGVSPDKEHHYSGDLGDCYLFRW